MLHNLVWKLGRIEQPPGYPVTFTREETIVFSELEVPDDHPHRDMFKRMPLYQDFGLGVVNCDLNFDHWLTPEYCSCKVIDQYAVSERSNYQMSDYGVADTPEQVIKYFHNEIADPDHTYLITVTAMYRADQPADGGWRWRKWGPYIGNHRIQYEYLYDEKDIEVVWCFHIYEVKANKE